MECALRSEALKALSLSFGEILRRKKKESNRPFILGFAVTVIVLAGLFVGVLLTRPEVSVQHLPASTPQYSTLWGKYVPDSFLLFGFENYTAIRHYNSSYPTQYSTLLNIVDLNVKLKAPAINYAMTISFASPNVSASFVFVNQQAFQNFTTAFEQAAPEAVPVGNATMYYVRNANQGGIQFGWIALMPADRGIAFAVGNLDAKTALQRCLELTSSDSLVSHVNIRQMLYIANGTSDPLAIGVQGFAGVRPAANRTMTVVGVSGSQVVIKRVLQFNSTSTAVADYNLVKQAYLASHQFFVFDSYVQANQYEPLSGITGAVRLVE